MTNRRRTPAHDFWHPRVEGQIRDCVHHHPEWFAPDVLDTAMVNSLAKRIVGEIVAGVTSGDVAGGPLLPARA